MNVIRANIQPLLPSDFSSPSVPIFTLGRGISKGRGGASETYFLEAGCWGATGGDGGAGLGAGGCSTARRLVNPGACIPGRGERECRCSIKSRARLFCSSIIPTRFRDSWRDISSSARRWGSVVTSFACCVGRGVMGRGLNPPREAPAGRECRTRREAPARRRRSLPHPSRPQAPFACHPSRAIQG